MKMKYDQIVADDDSLATNLRNQMVSSHNETDHFLCLLAYYHDLTVNTESTDRIAVLGGIPPRCELDDSEEDIEQTRDIVLATNLQDLKRETYPKIEGKWQVIAIDDLPSSRLAATLGSAASEDHTVLIVTSDKRLLAHVGDYVHVLYQGPGDDGARLWCRDSFFLHFGFRPELYPVLRALTCADLYDEAPFMGARRAVDLLQSFPDFYDILNQYDWFKEIVEDALRSRIGAISKHLKRTLGHSLIRTCPHYLGLWDRVRVDSRFLSDGGDV